MGDKKSNAEKEKAAVRRRRFWKAAQLIVGPWIRSRFDFTFDKSFEPAGIDGPVLVAINHASAYDPLFVGVAFRNKPLTFIASEHILRGKWGPFLDKHISFIPHQKGAKGSRTALVAMKRMKRGESVFLAPEGEQSWDGRALPVMPYTGKMVKGSGATLVNYRLEGAYLSAPRWAFAVRKGKVYGHPAGVYSPEALRAMTDAEVEALIAKDLAFDTYEWQKAQPGGPVIYKCKKGGNADGLERSVFTCPACGRMDSLRSEGDCIGCDCGFRARLAGTGFFAEMRQGDGPCVSLLPDQTGGAPDSEPLFETVCEWEEFDRKALADRLRDPDNAQDPREEIFCDDDVTLVRIEDGHNETEAARGRLTLERRGGDGLVLCIGEHSFSLKDISSMTMVLAARVVFSDKSGYYELRAAKGSRTNLRKYVIAREVQRGLFSSEP